MQRFYQDPEKGISSHLEINRRTAFHEAGHAAAIYLENKRNKLPSIYFQIQLHKHNGQTSPFFTKICGGRQIGDVLMMSREGATNSRNSADVDSYQIAYEADIINYLAGPLAEAKYVSLRDNETFNINLLRPESLNNYGGNADLVEVQFYLDTFLQSENEREAKLNELFAEAFRFIQVVANWKRIIALANYILNSTEEYLCFEQVKEVLQREQQYAHIHWL
jgi:hypothetical protein